MVVVVLLWVPCLFPRLFCLDRPFFRGSDVVQYLNVFYPIHRYMETQAFQTESLALTRVEVSIADPP